jgi:cytochrome c peroxidase
VTGNSTHKLILLALAFSGFIANSESLPNLYPFPDAAGQLETYNIHNQPIDLAGPFFQSLGTNGRSCGSCHRPAQGWSISPHELKLRFDLTQGLDPIFRANDGSNCDHNIDTSTVQGRRKAYGLLLNKGLIRIEIRVPETAEFDVMNVANPYGCSDSSWLQRFFDAVHVPASSACDQPTGTKHCHLGWT